MEANRLEYGRCSFILPKGYEIDETASPILGEIPEAMLCLDDPREPVILTLSKIRAEREPEEFDEYSDELDMDEFSINISVNTLPAQFNEDPLEYLQKADEALADALDEYDVQFCKKTRVGIHQAAKGQSSFVSNFVIYRLCIAWLDDVEMVVANVFSSENFLKSSWEELTDFVESFQFLSQQVE